MGFMDKAKKMAEQAQAKLDEAQKQFNAGERQGEGEGPAVEYDQHGRPIAQPAPETSVPPHGDPLAGSQAPPPPTSVPPVPPRPGDPPTGHGDPLAGPAGMPPPADAPGEDRNNPDYAPPKLSSGDPLAG